MPVADPSIPDFELVDETNPEIVHDQQCLDYWSTTPTAAAGPEVPRLQTTPLGYCRHGVWIRPEQARARAAEQAS